MRVEIFSKRWLMILPRNIISVSDIFEKKIRPCTVEFVETIWQAVLGAVESLALGQQSGPISFPGDLIGCPF